MRISISGNYTRRIKMKVNVANAVKHIVNWAFPLFWGGLLYLVYDDYRDNGTATEEQLLMISRNTLCR